MSHHPATAPAAPGLQIDAVNFAYSGTPILSSIDLDIAAGSFVSLLGPSGCGKTTLLRLLAGLELPQSGRLAWQGRPLAGPSLDRGVVFQDYSLFPWMTLAENVELALAKADPHSDLRQRRAAAAEFLGLVGLDSATAKYPYELSGGMQQRGAIARTFALGSPVLLMDEPFGALDPLNRAKIQDLLLAIWSGSNPRKTVVFVTHDIEEAIYLSDLIVMLGSTPGRVIQQLDVAFPRPRQRRELVRSPEFAALRQRIDERFQQDLIDRIDAESLVTSAAEGI